MTRLPGTNRTANVVLGVALVLASTVSAHATIGFDHEPWTTLLQHHVDDDGRVAYRDLAAQDATALDAYLAAVAAADPAAWPRDEQLAFWLNAYNACVFRAVLDGRNAESLAARFRMFMLHECAVAGRELTLYALENDVVRPMGESRIHFALVCASASCPKLMRRAWQAATLDADLDAAARRFVADPVRNVIRDGAPAVHVSAIFDWYDEDFGGSMEAIRSYVARFAPATLASFLERDQPEVRFLDYDWTLNAQPGQRPD